MIVFEKPTGTHRVRILRPCGYRGESLIVDEVREIEAEDALTLIATGKAVIVSA